MAVDDSGRTWLYTDDGLVAGQVALSRRINDFTGDTPLDFTAVLSRGRILDVRNGSVTAVQTSFMSDFLAIDGPLDGVQSIVTQSALLRRAGDVVSVETVPAGAQLSAVRRFDDDTVIAVGPDGQVVNGTSGGTFYASRPVAEDLIAIAGQSPDRVWVAGENGRVLSIIDGDVTVFKTPGPETLRGIIELDECDILFFGDSGALYRFDCFGFTDISDMIPADSKVSGPFSRGLVDDSGAGIVLIGSPVTPLESFAGFPTISIPADDSTWDGQTIEWAGGSSWGATHCQGLLTGLTGYSFWQLTANGAINSLILPDFGQLIGYTPNVPGPRKMNLTCSRSPTLNINDFDYRALYSSYRQTWAVDLSVFY